MGEVTEILTGKTGTMTTEDMEVVSSFAQYIHLKMFRKNTLLNCAYGDSTVELLKESILFNTEAHIEMTENSFYIPVGNGTEVSLIKWLQNADVPVHEILASKEGKVLAEVPFNSKLKRSITAVQHPTLQDTVRIYIKGAPETVVNNCKNHFTSEENLSFNEEGVSYKKAVKAPLSEQDK